MTDYSKWIGRKLTIPDDVAPPGARPYRVEVIRLETMFGAGGVPMRCFMVRALDDGREFAVATSLVYDLADLKVVRSDQPR
jgi:hypothetical protein